MLYSSAFIATLVALPAIITQATEESTASATNTTSTPAANSTTAPTVADTSATGSLGNFAAPTVTGSSCGTTQQNFNQCVTKVAKDINSCSPTDNVCLCQTYANIAACYNGCRDLAPQQSQYQDQSAQYCATAGVKLNTTATMNMTTMPNMSTTTTTTTNTTSTASNTTPLRNTSSAASTPASTFAANSAAPCVLRTSASSFIVALSAVVAVFVV